jgi:hypothetical protein
MTLSSAPLSFPEMYELSAASKNLSGEERGRLVAAITRDSGEVVLPYTDATGLAFELSTNVATARV